MLRNHRLGFGLFTLLAILISLFPPMTIQRESIDYNVGFRFLFDWNVTGHSNRWNSHPDDYSQEIYSELSVNRSLIALEYILAALCGTAIEVVLAFDPKKGKTMPRVQVDD